MNIARVHNGVVVNIEVADEQWVAENDNVDGFRIIPISLNNPAFIGLGWSEETGFEQPSTQPYEEPIAHEIDDELDSEIEDALSNG